MIKNGFTNFFIGSLVVILLVLALIAGYFTNNYIKKEKERAGLSQQQLLHFFDMKYRSMSEEMWTKSYEAIDNDVSAIVNEIRSKDYNLVLINETGNCVYSSSNYACVTPPEIKNMLSRGENIRKLEFDSKSNKYIFVAPLMVGSIVKGFLYTQIADPFEFYRGNFIILFISVLRWPILYLLVGWFLWSLLARQFFLKPYLQNVVLMEKKNALADLAAQVAHDIRSPLSAMEMISSQLGELPEEKRIIIRNSLNRIRDIANSLSLKNIQATIESPVKDVEIDGLQFFKDQSEITLLLPVLDLMVTEKRIENRDKLNASINFQQTEACYGLFANIKVNEIKRVLSNIINNAIESLPEFTGKVDVFLGENNSNQIQIVIQDTGKGIPKEVLPRLGIRGNTFHKHGGSGLGLAHAKEVIAILGGSVEIDSQECIGTRVTLNLPKQNAPTWFVPKVVLKSESTVVVFDDDQSIHQIWNGRIESRKNSQIKQIHFSSTNELRKYYGKNFADLGDALFLMDYEILNHKETGLDLIEELGIQSQSILVTSRYEEPAIRDRCEKLKIRLIPKSMSGFVPIEILPC